MILCILNLGMDPWYITICRSSGSICAPSSLRVALTSTRPLLKAAGLRHPAKGERWRGWMFRIVGVHPQNRQVAMDPPPRALDSSHGKCHSKRQIKWYAPGRSRLGVLSGFGTWHNNAVACPGLALATSWTSSALCLRPAEKESRRENCSSVPWLLSARRHHLQPHQGHEGAR